MPAGGALPATPTSLPVATPTSSVPTATDVPSPSPTPALASPTATDVPPTRPAAPPAQPAALVSASLTPATVAAGGTLSASVSTTGSVTSVDVYLGSGAPNAPAPLTYALTESSPGTWTGGGAAPTVGGQYHYTVGLFTPSGRRVVLDNDAWNVTVSGGSSGPAAAAFPDDIPLAPGFNYGNPTPATFTTGGQTVNGAEVVGTAAAQVDPSTVGQFYSIRLPRAGWIVTGSSAGSISAVSGDRVCLIQYSASSVQIFYS